MGMIDTFLRYWLLFRIMFFIVSLPITLASPAGTNLPSPFASIISAALMRNSRIKAAFPVLHLILSTSVESWSLEGPIPIEVWKLLKGGQLIFMSSPESLIVFIVSLREGSSLRASLGVEDDCFEGF